MKTVAAKFASTSTTADVRRTAAAETIRIDRIGVADFADVDDGFAGALGQDDSFFIYALAARKKTVAPALITVEMANGLALQMIKG